MRSSIWVGSVLAFVMGTLGCGSDPLPAICRIDGECVSGRCGADGTCTPPALDASTSDAAVMHDGGSMGDGGSTRDGGVVVDAGMTGCVPNNDGVIESRELPFSEAREARYRVSTDVDPFASALRCTGNDCGWDFVDVGGQTVEQLVTTQSLNGQWFASDPAFATATFASVAGDFEIPFVCSQVQVGVYRHDADGLWLLGLVSELESGGTKLVYDPPVAVLDYPLEINKTWRTDTFARGPLCGSPLDYAIEQTWTSEVDGAGYLETPYGRFENVLRVNTRFERALGVGVTPTQSRTHTFVAECFTSVGVVLSEDGDDAAEISPAREVRRLSPF